MASFRWEKASPLCRPSIAVGMCVCVCVWLCGCVAVCVWDGQCLVAVYVNVFECMFVPKCVRVSERERDCVSILMCKCLCMGASVCVLLR